MCYRHPVNVESPTHHTTHGMAAESTSGEEAAVACLNLHHAAAVGNLSQCQYFLDVEGVDVNALNAYDESALYCAW